MGDAAKLKKIHLCVNPDTDQRGALIEDLMDNNNFVVLNNGLPTHLHIIMVLDLIAKVLHCASSSVVITRCILSWQLITVVCRTLDISVTSCRTPLLQAMLLSQVVI